MIDPQEQLQVEEAATFLRAHRRAVRDLLALEMVLVHRPKDARTLERLADLRKRIYLLEQCFGKAKVALKRMWT